MGFLARLWLGRSHFGVKLNFVTARKERGSVRELWAFGFYTQKTSSYSAPLELWWKVNFLLYIVIFVVFQIRVQKGFNQFRSEIHKSWPIFWRSCLFSNYARHDQYDVGRGPLEIQLLWINLVIPGPHMVKICVCQRKKKYGS